MYALTPQGLELGRTLAAALPATLYAARSVVERAGEAEATPFGSLPGVVAQTFFQYSGHVFIGATGIAVRVVAPHLQSKDEDPAVVVVSPDGKYAISLLSGHLGGANQLAERVALAVGAAPVITTATDAQNLPAIEVLARYKGLRVGDLSRVKHVSAALLAGERVQAYDPAGMLGLPECFAPVDEPGGLEPARPGVWVSPSLPPQGIGWEKLLALFPPVLHAGMGCRRGTGADEILHLLRTTLAEAGLALESVAALATVEDKAREPGLLAAAGALGFELTISPKSRLRQVAVPNPSFRVTQALGIPSVAEACALDSARGGPLLIEKTKSASATVAIALAPDWPLRPGGSPWPA